MHRANMLRNVPLIGALSYLLRVRPHLPRWAFVGLLFFIGCDSDPIHSDDNRGNLVVVTSTAGSVADPAGYMFQLKRHDLTRTGEIGSNDRLEFNERVGPYELQLYNVASHCTTEDNPRTVELERLSTTETTFEVTCR